MDEPHQQPARDQFRLPSDHRFQECSVARGSRVMPRDRIVRERPDAVGILAGGEILEGADADVAGGDAGDDGAGQVGLADHGFAGRDGGQRPRGGDAEGVHGLGDQIFPENGAERGAAVPAAGEGGAAGALELDVAALHFAEQVCPAVT